MAGFAEWLRGIFKSNPSSAADAPSPGAASLAAVSNEPPPGAFSDALPAEDGAVGEDANNGGATGVGAPPAPDYAFPGTFWSGWRTDSGIVRDHNEDALLVFVGHQDADDAVQAFGLFMVADGMGGHQNGEVASSLALRVSAGQLISQIYLPLLSGSAPDANQPALTDMVRDAVFRANQVVMRNAPGSGSTLTYGMVLGDRLFVGHVGDSRAYLLRPDEPPKRLTRDHSFVNRLIEMGELTPEEALVHPQRNVLYRAIGQPENLEVDVSTHLLQDGDRLLFCSDGLWNMLEEAEIWEILDRDPDPQRTCDALVQAANEAGGNDNITVVLTTFRA